MNTSQFDASPDKVDHWTPESHWCGDCWSWVVDCQHVVEPLASAHHAVKDAWIRSVRVFSVNPECGFRLQRLVNLFHVPGDALEFNRFWDRASSNGNADDVIGHGVQVLA